MANGINSSRLHRQIKRYGKSYSQDDVVREHGLHPANGDPGGNSLGGPPFGLRLGLFGGQPLPRAASQDVAAPSSGTTRRGVRARASRGPRLECAKLLFGLPGWEFGVNRRRPDRGPGRRAQGPRQGRAPGR